MQHKTELNTINMRKKNPTKATAEGRELTNAEAEDFVYDHTESFTFYYFTKKGGRK